MRMELVPIRLDLRVNWKISRNESLYKNNFALNLNWNNLIGLGEVAPNIRYGETPENIQEQFNTIPRLNSPQELLRFCEKTALFHSLKCALICAAVEVLAKEKGQSVQNFLGVNESGGVYTSMSVPIMKEGLLEEYLESIKRFSFIKIKVNQDNAASFVKQVARQTDAPIRVDANEGFTDIEAFTDFIEKVKGLNIQFIEQPFAADQTRLAAEAKKLSPFELMADESIEDSADFDVLATGFDSINIKLMKTGGYLKAIELIKSAREKNMKVMLGCMIESSLGISLALKLASLADYYDLDGSLLIKNDPFNFIVENNGFLSLRED